MIARDDGAGAFPVPGCHLPPGSILELGVRQNLLKWKKTHSEFCTLILVLFPCSLIIFYAKSMLYTTLKYNNENPDN